MRYEAVNAMLLNEFLKAHRKSEDIRASASGLAGSTAASRIDTRGPHPILCVSQSGGVAKW